MRIGKSLMSTVVATLAGLSLVACAGSSPAATSTGQEADGVITLRVAGNSNATVLPFWVAQEKGMFAKHKLEVKYTKIENIATLPPALGTSFDLVLSTPTLVISSNSQGIPIQWVAGSSVDSKETPASFLMVKKDSGITDVTQLRGKTIGVLNETGTLHTATLYWLKKSGVEPSSVKVVQVDGPAQADQLRTGRVQAVETVTPFNGQVQKLGGGVSLGTPYRAMADTIAPIMWAAQTPWAQTNGEAITRFVAALDEARQYIGSDDAGARAVLKKQTGYPDQVVAALTFPQFDTSTRRQDVELWLEAMRAATGFKGDVDVDTLVYTPTP
jgi:ABC-type nitrate/sulfonate/bicarbonate transport system substrate-binding protein